MARKFKTVDYAQSGQQRLTIGDCLPDHSTIAWFRKQFLSEIKVVFAQVLLIGHEMGYLKLVS